MNRIVFVVLIVLTLNQLSAQSSPEHMIQKTETLASDITIDTSSFSDTKTIDQRNILSAHAQNNYEGNGLPISEPPASPANWSILILLFIAVEGFIIYLILKARRT